MLSNREMFFAISEYENYEISNFGRVRNVRTARILKNQIDTNGYYKVNLYKNSKKRTHRIHQLVANAFLENPNELKCIDHRDRNKLNNYYENLRWCSYQQNSMNATKASNRSSGFKGVSFHKQANKWTAQIMTKGKLKYLGLFESEKEAAKMYNEKAIELFGDFAKLNDISDSDDENTDEENTEDDNTNENET